MSAYEWVVFSMNWSKINKNQQKLTFMRLPVNIVFKTIFVFIAALGKNK